MKNYLRMMFAAAACVSLSMLTNAAVASDISDRGRVSAVVELTDGELDALLQTGIFKFSIPYSLRNKVNSLILKRPERYKDDIAVRFNDVDKRSNTIDISVDDSTIEQIEYQPVELKIYESGYTNVLVHYRPGNSETTKKPSKADSVVLKTNLKSGKSLTGRLFQTKQFTIKSNLGNVKVKLKDVSQITVLEDGDLKVMLFNGDLLTGKCDFSTITINSPWGLERIKLEDIATIVAPLSIDLSANQNTQFQHNALPVQPRNFAAPVAAPLAVAPWPNQVPVHYPAQPINANPWPVQNHQFPLATGRIDTLPASPRQIQRQSVGQNVIGNVPQGSVYGTPVYGTPAYGTQGYGTPVYGTPVYGTPIYGTPVPTQNFPTAAGYSLPSAPQEQIFGGLPVGHMPTQQVPMSEFPIGDPVLQQPLPLMKPDQSNNFWLFPQN